ncbi:Histidine decarboxylase [Streptomyces canarius]
MRSHLLNGLTAEHYRRSVTEGVERVAAKLATTDRPFTGVTVDALSPTVDAIDLDRPLGDTLAVLDELEDVYLRDAVYFHHPRYLAHLNCPVVIPAVLAEAVLCAVNSSLDTWDQSAGGTLIERKLIDWTAARIGLGPAADGVFTSGGTQSNLQALLLAREEAKGDDLAKLRVFASEASHFSVRKSAKLLGLGPDAVVTVPVDHDKRMQTVALAHELERCRQDGLIPMAVVATAGTTDFGSIDPLPEIAGLCAQYGVWMHVDAAYGCGLLASLKYRDRIDGIERADSVTVDYHKSFFQPVSSSAVLVRDAATLRHATYHAEYLNPRRMVLERIPNQVDKSGLRDGTPAFLTETYDPAHRELTGLYEARPGDVGMHFLTPATDTPEHGFTRAVITAVMARLFEDPAVRRVVVEPDVRNTAVHALNAAVGFVPEREIDKPEKRALLSFCTREQFEKAVTA